LDFGFWWTTFLIKVWLANLLPSPLPERDNFENQANHYSLKDRSFGTEAKGEGDVLTVIFEGPNRCRPVERT